MYKAVEIYTGPYMSPFRANADSHTSAVNLLSPSSAETKSDEASFAFPFVPLTTGGGVSPVLVS